MKEKRKETVVETVQERRASMSLHLLDLINVLRIIRKHHVVVVCNCIVILINGKCCQQQWSNPVGNNRPFLQEGNFFTFLYRLQNAKKYPHIHLKQNGMKHKNIKLYLHENCVKIIERNWVILRQEKLINLFPSKIYFLATSSQLIFYLKLINHI